MIDPNNIELSSLPFVDLAHTRLLPEKPCIYLAIDSNNVVQYVGQSVNPRQRWSGHHRYGQLEDIGGVKIAYMPIAAELMNDVESALIDYFNPPLNHFYPSSTKGKTRRICESISLSINQYEKCSLEIIAFQFGYVCGDRGNISALMKAIAQGKLRVDWADAAPADNPKRAAINAAIALIQEGLSKLLRLL